MGIKWKVFGLNDQLMRTAAAKTGRLTTANPFGAGSYVSSNQLILEMMVRLWSPFQIMALQVCFGRVMQMLPFQHGRQLKKPYTTVLPISSA
jgi:hypothetical protein